jgi:hypothetical protein
MNPVSCRAPTTTRHVAAFWPGGPRSKSCCGSTDGALAVSSATVSPCRTTLVLREGVTTFENRTNPGFSDRPPAGAVDRWSPSTASWILQATSTKIGVVSKSLKTRRRGFVDRTSPSAKTPSRDILFPCTADGRKAAERGLLRPFVRTMRTGLRPTSGRFSSLLAHFLRSNRTTAILVRMLKAR